MQALKVQLLITLLKSILGDKGFIHQIQDLVMAAFSLEVSGEEKKAFVLKKIAILGKTFTGILALIAPMLISGLIEILVAQAISKDTSLVGK